MALNTFAAVGLSLLAIGLLLHIIGLATPEWSVSTYGNYKVSSGLWEYCSGSTCVSYTSSQKSSAVEASGAFSIIGMLAAIAALAAGCFHFVMGVIGKPQNPLLPMVTAAASGISLIASIITLAVYGGTMNDTYKSEGLSVSIGYSFALCIAGGILIPIGGGIFFVASKNAQQ